MTLMGLFSWLSQRPQRQETEFEVLLMEGTGRAWLAAVGESYYQDALWKAVGRPSDDIPVRQDVIAMLVPEPDNKSDRNAIAVFVANSNKVGYLARDDAASYAPWLREKARRTRKLSACNAVIAGGGPGREALGIWLDLDEI